MKCFRVMSSGDLNSASKGLIIGFSWKMLFVWPFKVEEMKLLVTLVWIRPSPQCVRTVGRNKTLRRCAIRPLKEDNIMHTRSPKCDEAFSVQTSQIWTNQCIMNSYVLNHERIILFKCIVKSKSSHEKKFLMKRKTVH